MTPQRDYKLLQGLLCLIPDLVTSLVWERLPWFIAYPPRSAGARRPSLCIKRR